MGHNPWDTQGLGLTWSLSLRSWLGVQVPYFNGPIFLENKTQVGKVEEIFGRAWQISLATSQDAT